MNSLNDLVATYRVTSKTEREKGTYFEELIRTYFRHEPRFADLYSDVWLYSDWAREIGGPEFGLSAKDTGIDLVARTQGTGEYHANEIVLLAYYIAAINIEAVYHGIVGGKY